MEEIVEEIRKLKKKIEDLEATPSKMRNLFSIIFISSFILIFKKLKDWMKSDRLIELNIGYLKELYLFREKELSILHQSGNKPILYVFVEVY